MRHNATQRRLINAMKRPPKTAVSSELDPMQEAFLRSLGAKGIIDLPDEPEQDEGDSRRKAMRELADWNRYLASGDYESDRESREQAEAEAERFDSLTTAQQLAEVWRNQGEPTEDAAPGKIARTKTATMPLNGAGVLMAAIRGLGAKNVTSNGQSATGTL